VGYFFTVPDFLYGIVFNIPNDIVIKKILGAGDD